MSVDGFSSTFANSLLNILTGTATPTFPSGLFWRLHTGPPGPSGASNVSAGSTTRVAGTFAAPSGGSISQTGTPPSWTNGGTTETVTDVTAWSIAAPLASPTMGSTSTATTGGTLAAATYFYKLTATNAYGETPPGSEVSQVTTGSTSTVTVNWTQVTGASGYKLYRSTSTGAEVFLTSISSGSTVTYTDTGSITPGSATPPSTDSTCEFVCSGSAAVQPPTGVTITQSGSGGSFGSTGTYYYQLTATNAAGETTASAEVYQTILATADTVTVNWTAASGATGYKVYRGTTSGGENKLITTISSGSTVTYADTGTAGSSVSPPTTNTAGKSWANADTLQLTSVTMSLSPIAA